MLPTLTYMSTPVLGQWVGTLPSLPPQLQGPPVIQKQLQHINIQRVILKLNPVKQGLKCRPQYILLAILAPHLTALLESGPFVQAFGRRLYRYLKTLYPQHFLSAVCLALLHTSGTRGAPGSQARHSLARVPNIAAAEWQSRDVGHTGLFYILIYRH